MHEFLDEIFFVLESGAVRSLESLNKSTACAVINFISTYIIHEDLYYVVDTLLQKWIKRENFNSQAISLAQKNTIHNSFAILLFNNIQMVKYLAEATKLLTYHA